MRAQVERVTERAEGAPGQPAESQSYAALVQRVAASTTFRKSNRLRDLFLYLCQHTLAHPGVSLCEQDVGVAVFGKKPDYDTVEDTLVRVQASQLRKKLRTFFDTEGHEEPIEIDIPKGSYGVLFRRRGQAQPSASPTIALPAKRRRAQFGWMAMAAALVSIAAVLTLSGVFNRRTPENQILWRDVFARGAAVTMVTSDASLVSYEDAVQSQLTLREYRSKDFVPKAQELTSDEKTRREAVDAIGKTFVHIADLRLTHLLDRIAASAGNRSRVVFARDLDIETLQAGNAVLMGSRRANPWMELFEDRLNFMTVTQEQPAVAYFQNRSPHPGERLQYRVQWAHRGYCRLAFLPNLNRTGSILIVSGTDMAATAAGAQFLASDRWLATLRSRLQLARGARFPHFEALLRADYLLAGTPQCDLVAVRSRHD